MLKTFGKYRSNPTLYTISIRFASWISMIRRRQAYMYIIEQLKHAVIVSHLSSNCFNGLRSRQHTTSRQNHVFMSLSQGYFQVKSSVYCQHTTSRQNHVFRCSWVKGIFKSSQVSIVALGLWLILLYLSQEYVIVQCTVHVENNDKPQANSFG